MALHLGQLEKVAALLRRAVRGDRIRIRGRIRTLSQASCASPARIETDQQHVVELHRGLALNASERRAVVEDHVVPCVAGRRHPDTDPELDGRENHGGLGDRALLGLVVNSDNSVPRPADDTLSNVSQAPVDLFLRGYRAFVAGDLDAIERMLDPEVEWVGVGEEAAVADREDVLSVLRERLDEEYQVTVDRCIGVGDDVVVSMRFSRTEVDPTDDRPLQSRRSYLVGRYAAIVTTHDGRVSRVVEYPHLAGALAAVGLEDENP